MTCGHNYCTHLDYLGKLRFFFQHFLKIFFQHTMEMEQPPTDIYAIIEGLINFSQIQSHLNVILLPSHVKVMTNLKRKSALTVEKMAKNADGWDIIPI